VFFRIEKVRGSIPLSSTTGGDLRLVVITVSLCEPYRRSASLSERAVAWLWLNMLNLCKSRREGALGRIDGLAPGEPYGNRFIAGYVLLHGPVA
jgi:hypothetical protein